MWQFKIIGFIAVIIATSAIGFLKSQQLKIRYKKLCAFQNGLMELKEHIRLNSGELDRILKQSFTIDYNDFTHLEKEDVEILKDFFDKLGMSDSIAEEKRCELYANLLNPQITGAKDKYMGLGKLYRSIGVLSGVFICIFFI